jgi:uncharacterized protein (TIGR02246 family)
MRILLAFLWTAAVWAQTDAAIEKAVLAANAEVTHAAEARDAERFFAFITGSVIQDGVLSPNPQAVRERVEPGFRRPVKVAYQWKQQKVTVLAPDTALVVGEGETIVTTDQGSVKQPFAQTAVWVLRDGKWKILHAHQSTAR